MYGLGVALAVASGVAHNIGMLLQKKAVDQIAPDRQCFLTTLVRHPLWLAGFIIYMGLGSALFYVLSNFRVGPILGAVLRIFKGILTPAVIVLFAVGSAILVITNMYGIAKLQLAFRGTNACLAIPIQQIPIQSAAALVYLVVFRLSAPSTASLLLFCLAIVLIIGSTFVLARRQAMMEAMR